MGIWRSFFLFITIFGTVISVAVLVVTARAFDFTDERNVLYQLVVILAGVGIFKVLLTVFIPDIPAKYVKILKRHENLVNKILEIEPILFDKEVKAKIAKVDQAIFNKFGKNEEDFSEPTEVDAGEIRISLTGKDFTGVRGKLEQANI